MKGSCISCPNVGVPVARFCNLSTMTINEVLSFYSVINHLARLVLEMLVIKKVLQEDKMIGRVLIGRPKLPILIAHINQLPE